MKRLLKSNLIIFQPSSFNNYELPSKFPRAGISRAFHKSRKLNDSSRLTSNHSRISILFNANFLKQVSQ